MVGYVCTVNKILKLPVPLFSLCFLPPVVHNYSNYTLTNSEHYLLSLVLKFIPTRVLSVSVLNQQLDELFVRSVRIKHFFHDNLSIRTPCLHKLFIKSIWTPPPCPLWIEIPLTAIRHELCSLFHSRKYVRVSSNLSCSEFLSLSNLRSPHNVKIFPADKKPRTNTGYHIVYEKEVSHLLDGDKFYERVQSVHLTS